HEETIMDRPAIKYAIGAAFGTAFALAAIAPAAAVPVLSNTAALKSAADSSVTEVRFIRRGTARRAAVAAGVGLAVGAAYGYGSSYPSYGWGNTPSANYGYTSYGGSYYGSGYAPYSSYSYNYGYAPYSSYSYNYGYTRGYAGYAARRVVRGVA